MFKRTARRAVGIAQGLLVLGNNVPGILETPLDDAGVALAHRDAQVHRGPIDESTDAARFLAGLLAFTAAQALALLAVVVIIGWAHGWHGAGHFFTTLTIGGLTGLLAALAVTMLAGGYATIRRITV